MVKKFHHRISGSDICKIEKGTDDDKSYIWYMTESVSRVIELKALEESSKLKHLVGCERSVILQRECW